VSGGSYNYLCYHSDSLSEHRADLASMADRLEGLPWKPDAAVATRRCLALIEEAQRLAESLSHAWHAIEWWDSGDWGEDAAREDVEAYQPANGQRAEDVLYRLVNVGNGVFELRPVPAASGDNG